MDSPTGLSSVNRLKSDSDPNLGRLLRDRYRLTRLIGKGAMGRVYEAKDTLLGDVSMAVKILSRAVINQRTRLRFEREARVCAQLSQKSLHIVRVTDYGVGLDDAPFYVMEHLQGKNLRELLAGRPLPLPRFLGLARQICLGLQCAHEGITTDGDLVRIVHRDLKPANIFILPDASLDELVKILDFGIAKFLSEDQPGLTSAYMGTMAYSSPEQMGGQTLDARSDIYSLGIILYEMLTGKMPLAAETYAFGSWYKAHVNQKPRSLQEANPSLRIPKALERLVMTCLAKLPGDRPQSVKDILHTLDTLEQRSTSGRQIGERIGITPDSLNPEPTTQKSDPPSTEAEDLLGSDFASPAAFLSAPGRGLGAQVSPATSADVVCLNSVWPEDKPQAEIVFPQVIPFRRSSLPTLWTMLSPEELQTRQVSRRYNQFLFLGAPHPMILWVTALYMPEMGARWLPCYLDLKTPRGQQVARLLGEHGEFRLLLFALGDPTLCRFILRFSVATIQRELLVNWANAAHLAPTGQPATSKRLLKAELDKVKVRALERFEQLSHEAEGQPPPRRRPDNRV